MILEVFVLLALFFGVYRWKHRALFRLKSNTSVISQGYLTVKAILKSIIGDHKATFELLLHQIRTSGISPRRLAIGAIRIVIVDDPDQVQKILTSKSSINKPSAYQKLPLKNCK
jgi:hypothetical protein